MLQKNSFPLFEDGFGHGRDLLCLMLAKLFEEHPNSAGSGKIGVMGTVFK
eukprot:EC832493.1.p3 GENE.EC832493.1~~EC832493.1.p3  ORF type:complete len:50 (-),score=5.62 EC832493.1:28-177(-)